MKFQAKKKKSIFLLYSRHSSADVDASKEKKKLEMILFYNANKVGADCFDQMARLYITRPVSRRCPVAVWGNILDIAAINSYILYKKITSNRKTRRQFIPKLVENLLDKPQLRPSNINKHLRGDDEGGAEAEEVSWCALRQQDSLNLYFMSKTYLWKMFTRQFQSD